MADESKSSKRPQRSEKSGAGARKKESNGGVDDPIQRAIGDKLRAVFEEVVQQPVPDRFAELLRKLAEQEQQKK